MKKIIAIIPARAGSKGIPNKNLRMINGHPLVWYTIDNALKSKYISEIIVTTDSPDVEVIAKKMQVKAIKRKPELAGDDVALDEVVYDAIKDEDCELVVTMQPTSPTLRPETLDKAIEYMMAGELDTLISAINKPHLSWREEEGRKVPNYERRLNRQYLPAHYLETGAFLITKKSCISEHNRIGEKVDVFEVTEEESVDVDTFADLKNIEFIMGESKIALYVNGNNSRGTGHIYRSLELADEFYVKPDIFYDINQTDVKIFGSTTHKLVGVNGIHELFDIVKKNQYSIFINDVLDTSIDYMIALRQALPGAKIINFEDDGEGIYKADLVINELYEQSDLPHVRVGEKYFISAKRFLYYEPIEVKSKVERIFIAFGGADPQNYTDRLLEIISKDKYRSYHFEVVLGRAKENVSGLMKYNDQLNLQVYHDIANIAEVMTRCDIGITSRGRTGYELAILGIPSIAMAQNKREEKHGFVSKENGFTYIGLNPSNYLIESTLDMYLNMDRKDREEYQKILLSHDLRNGRNRVMNLIHSL